jgi:hypothetical protein
MFDGPVLVTRFRCVAKHEMQKASRAVAGGVSTRCHCTTSVTQVRNCPFFVTRNCCVDAPALCAMLVKKMVCGEIQESPSFWYSTAHGTFFLLFSLKW